MDNLNDSYYIPLIGEIPIAINQAVCPFYRILQYSGELERLHNLTHLGCLASVFPGVKHTRFDYIALMLHLTNILKLEGTSRKRKIGGLEISGKDILQLIILASNIGHIPGTFSVEKGILKYLYETKLDFMDLFEAVNEPDGLSIKQVVLETGDYTRFNRVLGLLKLDQWTKYLNTCTCERELLWATKEILTRTLIRERQTENDKKLCYYFDVIRQISYLTLDCLYLPVPLTLNFGEFIKSLGKRSGGKSSSLEDLTISNIADLIHNYERAAYEKIYHSAKARVIVALTVNEVVKKLKTDGIGLIFEWLSRSRIQDIGICLDKIANFANSHEIKVTVHSRYSKYFESFVVDEFISKNVLSLEDIIQKESSLNSIQPSIVLLPNRETDDYSYQGELILDLLSSGIESKGLVKEILTLFCVFYNHLNCLGLGSFFGQLFCQVIECAIKEFVKTPIRVTLHDHSGEFFDAVESVFITPSLLPKRGDDWIKREYFPKISQKELSRRKKQEYHEHMATWELIKNLRNRIYRGAKGYDRKIKARLFFVVPTSIKITETINGKSLAEFDGGILEIRTRSKKGILYIVEAKRIAKAKR
ncbi:MAG TPA: hypothetical protein ENG16_01605, partial [Archaeoglobus sp.]|nr:hypothetical protein [Archaeoglobus sp.]